MILDIYYPVKFNCENENYLNYLYKYLNTY